MRRIFSRKGWEVLSASTVAEGLARLEPAPDCLLLDLMLPDGDGEAVLRRVREAGLATRVIVVTGVGEEGRLDRLRDLAPEAVLIKPIDLGEVLRRFRGNLAP